jgi:hypothetical protein
MMVLRVGLLSLGGLDEGDVKKRRWVEKMVNVVAKPRRPVRHRPCDGGRGVAFRVAVLSLVDACNTLQPQHLNRRDARGVFYPWRSITRRDTLYSSRRRSCFRTTSFQMRINQLRDQTGPTGLVGCANPATGVAMKIFKELQVIAEMRVVLQFGVLSKHRATSVTIT